MHNFIFDLGKTVCPFIETLSFGSDFNIKCNNSYLIINEINVSIQNKKTSNRSDFRLRD